MINLTFYENVTRCHFYTKHKLMDSYDLNGIACCVTSHIQDSILNFHLNAFDWNLSMCSSDCNTLTM